MAPDVRLGAVLFGSIALWLPALAAFLAGSMDAGTVAWRYVASLAGTWVALTVLSALVRGYRSEPEEGDGDSTSRIGRRADDAAPGSTELRDRIVVNAWRPLRRR